MVGLFCDILSYSIRRTNYKHSQQDAVSSARYCQVYFGIEVKMFGKQQQDASVQFQAPQSDCLKTNIIIYKKTIQWTNNEFSTHWLSYMQGWD